MRPVGYGSSSSGSGAGGGLTSGSVLSADPTSSSFSSILQRTRSNIDRINHRYGAVGGNGTASMVPTSSQPVKAVAWARDIENMRPQGNFADTGGSIEGPSSAAALLQMQRALEAVTNRLSRLEQQQEAASPSDTTARLRGVDESIASIRSQLDSVAGDVKDLQRTAAGTASEVGKLSTAVEIMQNEMDTRRSVISKLDSWVRQGEAWRAEIETQLADIQRQLRAHERSARDASGMFGERVTRADMDALRDRLNVQTQQAVNASVAAWHDKIEAHVRIVERQIAALRLGSSYLAAKSAGAAGADASSTTATATMGGPLSDDDLTRILSSQPPSEIMLKGVVAAELRDVEATLKDRVAADVRAAVHTEVSDAQKLIRVELRDYVGRIAAEAGLASSDATTTYASATAAAEGDAAAATGRNSALSKVMAAKRSVELELNAVQKKMEDIGEFLYELQRSQTDLEVHVKTELRSSERRMDETVMLASSHVAEVQDRCAKLTARVQDGEDAQRKRHFDLREEVLSRQKEVADAWASERFELDRRIVLAEKAVTDMVCSFDASRSAIDSALLNSEDFRRMQSAAVKVEGMQVEVLALRADMKLQNQAVVRLEESAARKAEVAETRERLATVEALASQVENVSDRSARIEEAVQSVKTTLATAQDTTKSLSDAQRGFSERLQYTDVVMQHLKKTMTEMTHEMRGANTDRVRDLKEQSDAHASLFKSHSALEDRVRACESQAATVNDHTSELRLAVTAIEASMPLRSVQKDLQLKVLDLQDQIDTNRTACRDAATSLSNLRREVEAHPFSQVDGGMQIHVTAASPTRPSASSPVASRRGTQYYPSTEEGEMMSADPQSSDNDRSRDEGVRSPMRSPMHQAPVTSTRRGTMYFSTTSNEEDNAGEDEDDSVVHNGAAEEQDLNGPGGVLLGSSVAATRTPPRGASRRGTEYFDSSSSATAEGQTNNNNNEDETDEFDVSSLSEGPAPTSSSKQSRDGGSTFLTSLSASSPSASKSPETRRGTMYFDNNAEEEEEEEQQQASPSKASSKSAPANRRGTEYFDSSVAVPEEEEEEEAEEEVNTSRSSSTGNKVTSGASKSPAQRRATEYFDSNAAAASADEEEEQEEAGGSTSATDRSVGTSRRGTVYFNASDEDAAQEEEQQEEETNMSNVSMVSASPAVSPSSKRRGTEYFNAADDAEQEYEQEEQDEGVDSSFAMSSPASKTGGSSPAVARAAPSATKSRRGTEYFDASEAAEVMAAAAMEANQPHDDEEEEEEEEEGSDDSGFVSIASRGASPAALASSGASGSFGDVEQEGDDDEEIEAVATKAPSANAAANAAASTKSKAKRRDTEYFDAGEAEDVFQDDIPQLADDDDDDEEEEVVANEATATTTTTTSTSGAATPSNKASRRGTEYFDAGEEDDQQQQQDDEDDEEGEGDVVDDDDDAMMSSPNVAPSYSPATKTSASASRPNKAPIDSDAVMAFDEDDDADFDADEAVSRLLSSSASPSKPPKSPAAKSNAATTKPTSPVASSSASTSKQRGGLGALFTAASFDDDDEGDAKPSSSPSFSSQLQQQQQLLSPGSDWDADDIPTLGEDEDDDNDELDDDTSTSSPSKAAAVAVASPVKSTAITSTSTSAATSPSRSPPQQSVRLQPLLGASPSAARMLSPIRMTLNSTASGNSSASLASTSASASTAMFDADSPTTLKGQPSADAADEAPIATTATSSSASASTTTTNSTTATTNNTTASATAIPSNLPIRERLRLRQEAMKQNRGATSPLGGDL